MLQMPRPHSDELLSSAVVRGCRLFGLSLSSLARNVMERQGMTLPLFTVSPLNFYAELFGMEPSALLAKHSVIPYSTKFGKQDAYERVVDAALNGGVSSKALGASIQSAIHGIGNRRFCKCCVADDLKQLGESYWRLSHQLPGAFVCATHNTVLQKTQTHIAVASSRKLELPQHSAGLPCLLKHPGKVWAKVAEASKLHAHRGLHPPEYRGGAFYKRLAEQGDWVLHGRATRSDLVAQAVIDKFDAHLLTLAGVAVSTNRQNWPALLMQENSSLPAVTLKHVLLEQLLTGRVDDEVDLTFTPPGPSGRPKDCLDRQYVAAAKKAMASTKQEGQRTTIKEVLSQARCWTAYRHHPKGTFPGLQKLVDEFQTSANAHRPQALMMLEFVPELKALASARQAGQSFEFTLGTRQDLVRAGQLLDSKTMAARLGVHWKEMKPMQREGRILCIDYMQRDRYPAFWCDPRYDRSTLEQAHLSMKHLALRIRWHVLVIGSTSKAPAGNKLTPLEQLAKGNNRQFLRDVADALAHLVQ